MGETVEALSTGRCVGTATLRAEADEAGVRPLGCGSMVRVPVPVHDLKPLPR